MRVPTRDEIHSKWAGKARQIFPSVHASLLELFLSALPKESCIVANKRQPHSNAAAVTTLLSWDCNCSMESQGVNYMPQ